MSSKQQFEEKAERFAYKLCDKTALPGVLMSALFKIVKSSYSKGAYDALASQWISVRKRLPEENEIVLVNAGQRVVFAKRDHQYKCWCDKFGDRLNVGKKRVTHWMPIPQLNPEKGER